MLWKRNYTDGFSAVLVDEKANIQGAARHGNNGSPLISSNRRTPAPEASVVCLDKLTGELTWKSQNDMADYTPPIRATVGNTDQLFCYTVKGLPSLNPENVQFFIGEFQSQLHSSAT